MTKQTTRIAVYGATGRMGQAVIRQALARRDCEIVAAVVRAGSELAGEPVRGEGLDALAIPYTDVLDPDLGVDVLIDFSCSDAFDAALALARERHIAFVSGTTGLSAAQATALNHAAAHIPVLSAANFSIGVALLRKLAALAAASLDETFDIDIIESHHRHKRDAPSGTAIALGRAIADAREHALDDVARYARHGGDSLRHPGEIGFAAVRGGDVIGDHTVIFAGDGERIELTHRAGNREIFAGGALRAARWLVGKPAGSYDITDVLG